MLRRRELKPWEQNLVSAIKEQHRFGYSVRPMWGKVQVQRFWSDTDKRETGHCDAAVKVKADLDSTTKYFSLQRHLKTLNDKSVVDVVLEPGGFSGQMNQQGWKLTEEGAEMVRDVLAA